MYPPENILSNAFNLDNKNNLPSSKEFNSGDAPSRTLVGIPILLNIVGNLTAEMSLRRCLKFVVLVLLFFRFCYEGRSISS